MKKTSKSHSYLITAAKIQKLITETLEIHVFFKQEKEKQLEELQFLLNTTQKQNSGKVYM